MADTIHENHRERMRKKYTEGGRDSMPDHEILEILLFSVIPRQNTNPLAHRLLHTFGSLRGIMDATMERLLEVEGVGRETAFFLKELPYFFHRCEIGQKKRETIIHWKNWVTISSVSFRV